MNIFKKLALSSLLLVSVSALSANAAVIEFKLNDVKFTTEKDGVETRYVSEAAPYLNELGTTMVPVRAVSEAFDAEVTWVAETQEVIIKKSENEIKLKIDSPTAYINSKEITLDSVPVIVNTRTFVPLRFIGEALDNNVHYVNATSHIIIDDTPIVSRCGDSELTFAEFKALYDISYTLNLEYKTNEMTDEEYEAAVLNLAVNNATTIPMFYDTFKNAQFLSDDIAVINDMIDSDNLRYGIPASGLSALIHENVYFASGDSLIYDTINRSTDEINKKFETEYVRAKHVLVEDEETANEVYKKAVAGEDFDTLVKNYGIDPGMTTNPDGYTFTYKTMVEEFEKATYALQPGQISAPVETTYGYHIIKREALPALTNDLAREIAVLLIEDKLASANITELLITPEKLLEMVK